MMYYDDDRQPVTSFEREPAPPPETFWKALVTAICMFALLMSLCAGLWIFSTL